MSAPPLVAIGGPTASGKSWLAMALAKAWEGVIISADSVQVYRGLDIGSAKPTAADRALIPHLCLDLLEPTERGDAMRWATAAADAVTETLSSGRVPILCGGTGLYFRALFRGLAGIPEVPALIEAELGARLQAEGPEALHAALAAVDPEAAGRIQPRDRQRVTRALAVHAATGRPLSDWQREACVPVFPPPEGSLFIWLAPERAAHRERLRARAVAMLRAGLIDEVRGLLTSTPPEAPALQTLGYRAIVAALLKGEEDEGALIEALSTAHARYAKRQFTWFGGSAGRDLPWLRVDPDVLDLSSPEAAAQSLMAALGGARPPRW